jgi:hypothetical protein
MEYPKIIYQEAWEKCNPDFKDMVIEKLMWENLLEEDEPKGALLLEYTHDREAIKDDYVEDNPWAKKVIVTVVKFLPEKLLHLIEGKKLYTYNMFTLLVVY